MDEATKNANALIAALSAADGMAYGPIFNVGGDVEEDPGAPLPLGAGYPLQPKFAKSGALFDILSAQFGAGLLRPAPEFDDQGYYLPTRAIVDTVLTAT